MNLGELFREIELRDVRSARQRAWRRLALASIGAPAGLIAYRLFHPHSVFHWKIVVLGLVMIVIAAAGGAIHDFRRVRHPEKGLGVVWLALVGLWLAGSALMFWIIVG